MQSAAPEAIDLAQESKLVHELYGTEDPACRVFARQCLTARRLLERGVRFIQIFAGRGGAGDGCVDAVPWDAHSKKNDRGHGCRDSGSVGILETHKMHLSITATAAEKRSAPVARRRQAAGRPRDAGNGASLRGARPSRRRPGRAGVQGENPDVHVRC